ncbi:Mitochondrial carrier protein ymc2 [Dispira simplex]|nr:Mitochondrial carrier protein ymc2 [Dispira simplex]
MSLEQGTQLVYSPPLDSPHHDEWRAIKDCVAGSAGGILQVFSGQPFDTVKVRLQTQPTPLPGETPRYAGTLDCVKRTYRSEGFGGFYRGTTTPLVGVGLCVSIQFMVLEHAKRRFSQYNQQHSPTNNSTLSSSQFFLAGAMAGLANSVVSGPVEHIRTRLQVQTASAGAALTYRGPWDCILKIYQSHGIAGLYKGQVATAWREAFGYGAYFLTYEWLVQRVITQKGISRDQLPATQVCLYGALAGFSMWGSVYPIDVIKSKLQTDQLGRQSRRYQSILDCARQTLHHEGVAGFYKGITPCLLRAAPANAATFIGFELAMRVLQ